MKRRVLSFILVIMMLITAMPTALSVNTSNYKLDWLVQSGIVEGRGSGDLALNKNITRAEFTKMVLAVTGELSQAKLYTTAPIFSDIPIGHWAKSLISYATQRGYLAGYQDFTFSPDNYIKLDECITILSRLNPDFVEPTVRSGYWAQPYIDYAMSKGILSTNYGYDKYNAFATRDTAFDIIYNEVQVYNAAKKVAEMETLRKLELEKAKKEEESKKEAERLKAEKEKEERESRRYRYDRDIEYRIYFDNNGGWGHMSTDYILGEGYYLLPWCRFEAPYGYHFDGWLVGRYRFEERDRVYIDRDVVVTPIWVKDGTTPDPKPNPDPDPDPDPTPDPTPDEKTFTVEFITDYGVAPKTVRVKEGNKVEKPADLSEDGYIFHGWYTDTSYEHEYDFESVVKENTKLYAKWEAIKYSIVVEEAVNGSIEVEKTEGLTVGETINIKATPNDGYQVDEITYTAEGAAPVKVSGSSFKMPAANITLKASFKIKEYNITVKKVDGITITVSSSARKDATVEVKAQTEPGYELVKLTIVDAEGNLIELSADNIFTMPATDVSISAELKKIEYTVKALEAEYGTVSVDKDKATVGDTINVEAKANDGYQLDRITYTVDGGEAVTVEGTSFIMPAGNVEVTATFKEKEYNIKVEVSPAEGGSIKAVPSASLGKKVTVEVNPAEGYEIDTLTYTEEGQPVRNIVDYAFLMPANNVTIKAKFKKIVYKVEVEASNHGKVEATPEKASIGDTITIKDIPDTGYQLDKITYTVNDGTDEFELKDKTFKMPAGNVKIKATFTDKKYDLTVITKLSDGTELKTEKFQFKYGEVVQLNVPRYEEYKLGWFDAKADNGETVVISNADKRFTMPASNLTVSIVLLNKTINDRLLDIMVNGAKNFDPTTKTITFDRPISEAELNVIYSNFNSLYDKFYKELEGSYINTILVNCWCYTNSFRKYDDNRKEYVYTKLEVTPLIRYHHYLDENASYLWDFNTRTDEQNERLKNLVVNEMRESKNREQYVESYLDYYIKEYKLNEKSDYDKVKEVHNLIITHAAYFNLLSQEGDKIPGRWYHDSISTDTINNISVHSAYAIAKTGIGVCQAYAGLFQKFMERFGIESYYVVGTTRIKGETGEVEGDGHAWNKLKLNGNYYNIDLTWDDPTDGPGKQQESLSGYEHYKYFLRSDTEFNKMRNVETFTHLYASSDYPGRPTGTLIDPNKDLDKEQRYFEKEQGNKPIMIYELLQKRPAEIERVYRNIRKNNTQDIKDTKKVEPAA